MFLNVCHGLGGESSAAESFAEARMNVMGREDSVSDGTDLLDLFSTAAEFEGLSARLGNDNSLFGPRRQEAPTAAPAEEPPMFPDLFNCDLGMGGWRL